MHQTDGFAGVGSDKTVQHLLQLGGNGPAVTQAGCLIDYQADSLSFLLAYQYLDGGISIG